jgi:filamentous hemagglutinin family protein
MKRFNCDFGSRFRILKGGKISLVVSAILSSTTLVFAAPTGGTVTSGTANISQSGNTTNITQSTNKATINWQDFSIKSNETVNFNQPNVNSITLNRVVGNERSIIDGALNANGQVWILNSNGILFNKDSKINTAGILATTKNITDADFNAGNYKFTGNSTAGVINMGTIEASDSGYVALLANTVQNNGTIKAYKGTVHLTGASEATINLNGNSIVSLTVNKGVLDALVENKGAVLADGGKIFLTTNAVDEILKGVVNNTGLIEANSLDDISGEVILFAHGGTANVSGTIEAVGGFVETSGKELSVADGTVIKAKKWLIDPEDVVIESNGGNIGAESVSATAIETALGIGNVEIQATNNITVNEAITVKNYTLTLNAIKDLNVNAKMTVSSGALDLRAFNDMNINETIDIQSPNISLNMIYGNKLNLAMNSDKTAFIGKVNLLQDTYLNINYDHYTIINTSTDLASLRTNDGTVRYVLGSDITSGMTNWTPIGAFAGKFDGLGHTVDGLTIDATSSSSNQGLFSNIFHGSVSNLALTSVNVNVNGTGSNNDEGHGALAGSIGENASISNIILQGSVKGNKNSSSSKNFGGLAGYVYGGTINNVHANVDVEGYKNIGGLIGSNSTGTITNSYAEGKVEGNDSIGGLVGSSYDANILNSYATGEVIGNTQVGGLAGGFMTWSLTSVTMEKSYATGKVTGTEKIGGLIGYAKSANIENVFATGDVTNTLAASKKTGALIGMSVEGSVKNSYASGQVTVGADTTAHLGGLIGANDDDFTDVEYSFYNKILNVGKSDVLTSGKTTAELKSLATYSTWGITEDSTLTDMYPRLAASGWVINPAAGTPTNGGSTGGNTGGGSTPTPVPNSEPTVTQDTKIEKVITTIVNNTTTNVNVPKDILLPKVNLGQNMPILPMTPTVQSSPIMQDFAQKLGVNQGEQLSLVSTTLEGQATQRITLDELKNLSKDSNNSNSSGNTPLETRVAVGDNSIVELVNGGMALPKGVDQEFYVVKNKK